MVDSIEHGTARQWRNISEGVNRLIPKFWRFGGIEDCWIFGWEMQGNSNLKDSVVL
jgi:hypothetical protein